MDIRTTRNDDHETSIEASRKVKALNYTALRQQVYRVLKDAPAGLTDSEIRQACTRLYGARAESTYRKRRTELVEMGLVTTTGEKRQNEAGSREKVWVAVKDESLLGD